MLRWKFQRSGASRSRLLTRSRAPVIARSLFCLPLAGLRSEPAGGLAMVAVAKFVDIKANWPCLQRDATSSLSVPSGLRVWPSARGGRAGTKAQSTRWQAIQHGGSPSSSGVAIALRRCPERRSILRTLIPRHPEVCPSQPIIVAAPSRRCAAPHPHHRPLLHPQRRQRGHLRLDKNEDKGRGARARHVGRCAARTMSPPIVSPAISYCGGNFRGAELLALRF